MARGQKKSLGIIGLKGYIHFGKKYLAVLFYYWATEHNYFCMGLQTPLNKLITYKFNFAN